MAELTESRKRDLLRQASTWWDGTGRHLIRKQFNEEAEHRRKIGGPAPAIICRGSPTPVLPSGILMGHPWEDLKNDERSRVLEVYMHQFTELKSPRLDKSRETLVVPSHQVN